MEKISIIVPVYNVESYLKRCVDSILKQTYKNLEIILVDDGSTDSSGAICNWYSEHDERIKVIHKINGGLSSARNAGIEIASGDYISFVDSDDWIVEDIYEYCIELAETMKCDVVDFKSISTHGEMMKFSSNEDYEIKLVEGKEILRDYLMRGQTDKSPFTVWRKLYRTSLFEIIRFPEGKINEDIATNYKVLMNCNRLAHTDKIGYYYFQNNNSITRNGFKKRDFDLLDACEELKKLTLNETYDDIKYLAKVKYARSYFSLLSKIAFYGTKDNSLDEDMIIKELTKKLRQSYFLLLRSPIPLNRKLIVTVMCIHINFIKMPLNIYKKISK